MQNKKKQNLLVLILGTIFTLFLMQTVAATTYYIDATNGLDINSGNATNAPWQTISKVNNQSFAAGDSILFKRGEVWREQLEPLTSGASNNYIQFDAYGSGAAPIINGADVITGWTLVAGTTYKATLPIETKMVLANGIRLQQSDGSTSTVAQNQWDWDSGQLYINIGADPSTQTIEAGQRDNGIILFTRDYVSIKNFDVRNVNKEGISIFYDTDYDRVTQNVLSNNAETGILIWGGKNHLISGNTVTGSFDGIYLFGYYDAIDSGNNISSNVITHSGNAGINIAIGKYISNNLIEHNTITTHNQEFVEAAGINLFYAGSGNIIRYNTISDGGAPGNLGHGIMVDDGTGPTQVYYNLIYNNSATCLSISGHDRNGGDSLYNNVCYHNGQQFDSGEIFLFSGSKNTDIKNNILVPRDNATWIIAVESGSTFRQTIDYNLYMPTTGQKFNWGGINYNFGQWKSKTKKDGNSIESDPKFVDLSQLNFHLKSNSPAINKGINVGITRDLDNKVVPSGSRPDMGVYEYYP